MDQPSEKARRLLGDDRRLPGRQLDPAQMLRPRTMLGEHARPMPPVGVHLDTPDMLPGSNTIEFAVANGCHRTPDLFDRVRIAGVLHHAKLVGTRMASDRPITEIHAEEERVRDSIQSASLASGHDDRAAASRRPGGPSRRHPAMVVRLIPVALETCESFSPSPTSRSARSTSYRGCTCPSQRV